MANGAATIVAASSNSPGNGASSVIPRTPSLPALTELTLGVPFSSHADFSLLHPLDGLCTFCEWLEDARTSNNPLSFAQLDQIRGMPQLHRVLIRGLAPTQFRYLLRSPHQLRWADVPVSYGPADEMCSLLATLPLQRWGHEQRLPHSIAFLPLLSSTLRDLQLHRTAHRRSLVCANRRSCSRFL